MAGVVHSIDELVGHTPLMELDRFERQQHCGAHILAKLEFFNPTGSVKDRAALAMIQAAEQSGALKPGGTIVEQTSGNTGIGLAAFATARGYRMEIFLERGASLERRLILQAYGARLLDYKDAIGLRPEAERSHPWQEPEREATLAEIAAYCRRMGAYFNNQAANPANPEAHFRTTGPEIWQDAGGNVDVLVCMAGTGGTGSGTARYLRSRNPGLRVVLVQPHPDSRLTPEHPDVQIIDGVLPAYGVPEEELSEYLTPDWNDEYINVRTAEAYATAHDVLHTEGLFLGTSAAAALHAAVQVGQRAEYAGKSIAVILPDNGMKYLSTPMYQQTI